MFFRWRWIFPSQWLTAVKPNPKLTLQAPLVKRSISAVCSLIFPDECRVCSKSLQVFSRIPVCQECLEKPEALAAEFFCVDCKIPFLNAAPLDENGRCALCRSGLRGFDAAYAFGDYDATLRELIHLYKFENVTSLAPRLAQFLARALPRDCKLDVIVPMPLHWRRQWKRGFNQSQLLAVELGRKRNLPVVQALRRRIDTREQAGLTAAERRINVAKAFEVSRPRAITGKSILIVDDVLTTGATLSACARALKLAGAGQVTVLTVARTDRRTGIR